MPKFRLLGGSLDFTEPGSPSHAKRFRNGDVLQSKHDLRQTFINKFVLVDNSTPLSLGEPIPNMHAIQSELAKIEAATPLKAAAVPQPGPIATGATETPISAPMVENVAPEPDDEPDAPELPQGKDVTKQFQKALEEDYKVFKNGKTFSVYNADDMSQVATGVNRPAVDDTIDADLKKRAHA